MTKRRKKRIAILGGGLASLTAAYQLAIQDRYDITVYQMGWRLGGQGASGRNQDEHDRIEEHGLHVWFGYYENAFNLMHRCYQELDRSPYRPLPDVYAAFTGHDSFVFEENIKGEWRPWEITFPSDNDFPGEPSNIDPESVTQFPDAWDFVLRLIRFVRDHFHATLFHRLIPSKRGRITNWPGLVLRFAGAAFSAVRAQAEFTLALSEVGLIEAAFNTADKLAKVSPDPRLHDPKHHDAIRKRMGEFRKLVFEKVQTQLETDDELRRHWIMLDLGVTCVIGMLTDGVLTRGFNHLNKFDFKEWLTLHGVSEVSLNSALIPVCTGNSIPATSALRSSSQSIRPPVNKRKTCKPFFAELRL